MLRSQSPKIISFRPVSCLVLTSTGSVDHVYKPCSEVITPCDRLDVCVCVIQFLAEPLNLTADILVKIKKRLKMLDSACIRSTIHDKKQKTAGCWSHLTYFIFEYAKVENRWAPVSCRGLKMTTVLYDVGPLLGWGFNKTMNSEENKQFLILKDLKLCFKAFRVPSRSQPLFIIHKSLQLPCLLPRFLHVATA